MNLKILLPHKVFANIKNVSDIIAETPEGSLGLLSRRLDCIAILVPGIFCYTTDVVHYLAVGNGILVKAGDLVLVSVNNIVGNVELGKLSDSIKKEFEKSNADQQKVRYIAEKLEKSFLSRLKKF